MSRTDRRGIPFVVVVLWVGHLLLVPFYVFDSGQPQPADAVALLFAVLVMSLPNRKSAIASPLARRMFLAVLYVLVIGIFHSLWMQDPSLLRYPAFYLYNAIVAYACMLAVFRYGERIVVLVFWGVLGSLALQLLLMPFAPRRDLVRAVLFFNNPNQLGYYALTCACLLTAPRLSARRDKICQALGLAMCLIFAVLSLSKSAMAAILILFCLSFVRRISVLVAVGLLLGLLYATVETDDIQQRLHDRITIRQSDDGVAERGYDRIVRHPEYLLFGAGEGAVERFDTALQGEIHSSPGTLLFSYGLIGACLVMSYLWEAGRRSPSYFLTAFVPIAIYGLTHNGLRSTLAWEMVAILACAGRFHPARKPYFSRRRAVMLRESVPSPRAC